MDSPSALFANLLARDEQRRNKPGPIKWCQQCGRKHPARQPCRLFLRTRVIGHGNRRGRRAGRPVHRTHRWAP